MSELFEEDRELTPEEAFLYSIDDAIRATIQCLTSAGVEEEVIWAAFGNAVKTIHAATNAVEAGEFMQGQAPKRQAA
jgi:hypothetical protein